MTTFSDLMAGGEFLRRHIGPAPGDVAAMLDVVGVADLDELTDRALPPSIRVVDPPDVPGPVSEAEALRRLRELASRNEVLTSLIGMGYHGTFTPSVVRRNVLEDPGWYTAYTPYQPEISQGRLEALLVFQTMVADLTGMELANASLLDEATAAAEAMTMLRRISRHEGRTFFVDVACHPQTIGVVRTRAVPLGITVVVGDPRRDLEGVDPFGVLLQYPGTFGEVWDLAPVVARVHEAGGLVAVAVDLLAAVLLTPPGEMGADVVVGSTQRFGVPMMFGGPHAAFLAARDAHKRQMPGRLVGVSRDAAGRRALRLALQTREQHIRRERATSNICTAQVLLAVVAACYAVYHGPEGLRRIAERTHRLTSALVAGLRAGGVEVPNRSWFDTITVRVANAEAALAAARARGINLRPVDDTTVGISLDETTTPEIVARLFATFDVAADLAELLDAAPSGIPPELRRTSPFLTHPVFHRHRSETEMLRYLRRLSDLDLALDRAMIPLGSCTMKLNGTTEMLPITWPEFADLHPFVPPEQAAGYRELIADLEAWLAELTGYDAVTLQPNSGASGELTGLLAIRGYHASRGEGHRDVCLIPASAHGTNPASAAMAGLEVVVVATAEDGGIDMEDLREKAAAYADRLAAIMITYPSTHGVFEPQVTEVCEVVHRHGGQVYIDGANLNAMVGLARPGTFGGDVSHLNLHKTFAIPHGGGGPGVGPVACRAHLAPFLPGHLVVPDVHEPERRGGPVAAAPFGSAGVLPISWTYLLLMGAVGLRRASQVAILSANYVASRLGDAYPVLYTGPSGLVAHECILDLRGIEHETGVTNEDVAKRLVDYGFHAPTMSFPVHGTLMVEPTESEPKEELDRFCAAMLAIRREIEEVAAGTVSLEASVLRRAPHPAADLLGVEWERPYPRERAAYPVAGLRDTKYWVPVGRVDNAWGDRHLVARLVEPGLPG